MPIQESVAVVHDERTRLRKPLIAHRTQTGRGRTRCDFGEIGHADVQQITIIACAIWAETLGCYGWDIRVAVS
jgi:hypothetical protein